jgi:hypothetical protein
MALEIRLLKDDEYPLVVDFFNTAKNIDHRNQKDLRSVDRFEWEFINCPFGKAIYVVAIENEEGADPKIKGTQCAIPYILKTSANETIYTAKGEDSLIDIALFRKYKKRDILREMYDLLFSECIKQNIKLIWGFTNMPATFQRIGFATPFTTKNAIYVLKPTLGYSYLVSLNQHNTYKEKFKIFVLTVLSKLYGLRGLLIPKPTKKVICSERITENAGLFMNSVPEKEKYCFINQNDTYFKWRTVDNPSKIKYYTKQFSDRNNNLIGEIVYSNNKGIAYIEQMLFDYKLPEKTKLQFIKKIVAELIHDNAIIIRFAGFENNLVSKTEIKLLKKVGFIFAKKGASFVIKSLAQEAVELPEANNFLLSRLYFQGLR